MEWILTIVIVMMALLIATQRYEIKCGDQCNAHLRDMLKLQKECYKAQEAVLVSTDNLVKIKEERIQNCEELIKKYSAHFESCKKVIDLLDKQGKSEKRLEYAKKLMESRDLPGQKLMAEKLDEAFSKVECVVVEEKQEEEKAESVVIAEQG